MKKYRYLLALIVTISALLLVTCSKDQPSGAIPGDKATVLLDFLKSSLIEQVNMVELQVTVDGTEYHSDQATVQEGQFDFESFELPTGEAVFQLSGLNSSGLEIYSGDTTVTIVGGVDNEITVTLMPAIPMVKLSPYYSTVEAGQQFTSTLELFNIAKFFNGAFAITYDPALMAYDTTIAQANTAWGTLIAFASDNAGTVTMSVSRVQGSSDTVPVGVYSLVNLTFTALTAGNTELELTVNVIDDLAGTIAEAASLYKDNQTVVITGESGDLIPPSSVNDLEMEAVTSTSVTLRWTAPGDDGNSGTASQYDIRYYLSNITTSNWNSATLCSGEPTPQLAGSSEQFVVTNLNPDTEYYFALKAADESSNWSGISNVVNITTDSDQQPVVGIVDLRSSVPEISDNMQFRYSDDTHYDTYYTENPHWKITWVDGYMEFDFTGEYDFIFHALGSTISGVSYCYVDVIVNGNTYWSDKFIEASWEDYLIPASAFSSGTNTIKIVLTGDTHFWVDKAWIQ